MDILHFLYHTVPGRILLKPLLRPGLSRAFGAFLDSRLSRPLIGPFLRKNQIRLEDYEPADYRCFNDCFSRRIKPELRPICMDETALVAPCDGLLSVWKIHQGLVLPIKQSQYSIARLLRNSKLAAEYEGGYAFVFRLCVDNYHRYIYVASGEKTADVEIPGVLHTVRPVALETVPVFTENSRVYTTIDTPHLGKIVQMEVGAMLVGKIQNHHPEAGLVRRGEEKGTFLYGGSTILVLVKEPIELKSEIAGCLDIDTILSGSELPVKMGEMLTLSKK